MQNCKLDIKKAYGHVNWDFLLGILRQMGFDDMWLRWMVFVLKLLGSPYLSMENLCLFASERELSQGDLLSPFLFIIAMEGLNSMMRRAISNSLD